MVSTQPRKQRKNYYNAPKHIRRKMMAATLSEELREQYNRRSLPVRKGDIVKIMRGKYKNYVGKIVEVDYKRMRIAVENVTVKKVSGKSVQLWIHPSKVMITKLDLSDARRKAILERSSRGGA